MASENVPSSILDMLKVFLAAKARGEQAFLFLETKNGTLTTKYRSVEAIAGIPASTSPSTTKIKKVNPARARRSMLRQEQFFQKKIAENKERQLRGGKQNGESHAAQDVGNTSNKPCQLLVNLGQIETSLETRPSLDSPIPQVDGGDREKIMLEDHYSFVSDFGEEDILFSLEEVFPPEKIATLLSRVRVSPLSADHQCHMMLRPVQGKKTSWPALGPENVDVFREVKIIE